MKASKSGIRGRAGARSDGRSVIGSPFATGAHHGGKVAGAGELRTGEPGSFAKSVRAAVGNAMSRGPASGSVPRGMKVYNQE